jgi:hypothetical protein
MIIIYYHYKKNDLFLLYTQKLSDAEAKKRSSNFDSIFFSQKLHRNRKTQKHHFTYICTVVSDEVVPEVINNKQ